ncbi:MAG: sensor histidine kinase [Lachnospiraceae bacterium]|nr:sensor histidine kinase [Lachnospiraceae bacterium]
MLIMPEGSNALLASTMGSSLVEVFSECVHLLIVIILVRCFKKQDSKLLSTIEWLRFAIVPICTLGIIMGLMVEFDLAKEQQQEAIFLLIAIGLVIMNIIIYFLLNDIIKREAILRRNQISTERTKNEIKRYENLSENYEKQRKLQHEYNHRLNSIAALARDGQIEELKEYLHRLNYEVGELNRVYDFKNTMLNALLNAKEHEMHRKGITFIIFSMNLDNLPIYNEDLVVILENLLNNAMEACEECEDKVVKLKITEDDRGTLLAVENTYVTAPIKVGDKFITTKNENRDFHGIGIENVKDVVEKYHGETMINVFEDVFRFTIRLPQITED